MDFTRQELIYLALGMRCLANREREKANDGQWVSVRHTFEHSAEVYEELAAKCERLKAAAPATAPDRPAPR